MGSHPAMSASIEMPARAVSSLILVTLAIIALLAGGIWFAVLVALGAAAGLREWHRLVNDGRVAPQMFVTGLSVVAALALVVAQGEARMALAVILAGAAAGSLWSLFRGSAALWHGFGAIYLGVPALSLVVLREGPLGARLPLGILLSVWSADTAAMLGGRLIGGPKLVPRLSPNKTWAGFGCGTVAAGIIDAVYVALLGGGFWAGFGFGVLIAVLGLAGDLFESWVKRRFRAKDSGGLIPGHGGVLDRIDSLLAVAPACALLIAYGSVSPFQGAFP